MKAFIYKGELYIRCIPGKQLFRSTMIHEVVNRGDIFAMSVKTQEFTVIPGKSEVEHIEVQVLTAELMTAGLEAILLGTFNKIVNEKPLDKPAPSAYTAPSKSQKQKLDQLTLELAGKQFQPGDFVTCTKWKYAHRTKIVGFQWNSEANCWQYSLRSFAGFFLEHTLRKVE